MPAQRSSENLKREELLLLIGSVLQLPEKMNSKIGKLIHRIYLMTYKPGEIILHKHTLNSAVFILIKGQVKMTDENGFDTILQPRDSFGERTLVTGTRARYTFSASDTAELLVLNKDVYAELAGLDNPAVRKSLSRLFSRFDDIHRERTTQMLSQEKERLKHEIKTHAENQNEYSGHLLNSIHYAKRLQDSTLPDLSALSHYVESFMVFLPKDIITGDFYWLHLEKNNLYLAAADSTGHGVPGAFTGLLCMQILNDIVKHHKDCSAAELLALVNSEVKHSFHLGNPDGMDCAMLRLNLDTHQIEFCGANRPMYIVRNYPDRISDFELPATRVSIGHSFADNTNFSNQYFSLQPADTIYLYTDGFPDQLGGEREKRMGSRKFREKLRAVSTMPLAEQHKELIDFHHSWRGKNEQTDDLLVLGMRPFQL